MCDGDNWALDGLQAFLGERWPYVSRFMEPWDPTHGTPTPRLALRSGDGRLSLQVVLIDGHVDLRVRPQEEGLEALLRTLRASGTGLEGRALADPGLWGWLEKVVASFAAVANGR